MKAAIFHKPGLPLSVEEIDLTEPKAGEVLVNIVGAFHGSARPKVDFPWILDLYMDGRLKLDELITKYRPIDEINEAFDDMNQGKTARTIISFR